MATIHVDGKEYEVDGADNLLEACLSLGLDVPYFCWHPALGSVGACRQCAVKQYQNADDKRGRLVMSCMTPASDGTYISIDDEEAKAFRENVVEWMMTNHPHDWSGAVEEGGCLSSTRHDRDDWPPHTSLSFYQANPQESGIGAVYLSRNEPLYRLLSVCALLQGLCRWPGSGEYMAPMTMSISAVSKMAR